MRLRLAAVVLMFVLPACGISRQDFQTLDQAGRQIMLALGTATPAARMAELRAHLATALAASAPRANSRAERALLDEYRAASAALDDLLAVVSLRDTSGQELLPLSNPLAQRLQKTYDLPVNTNEPPSIYASEALHEIQTSVRARLAAAGDRLAP